MTYSPDYDYWKNFDTLRIADVAALMKVIEPTAVGEIVVNGHGDGVDLSYEEAQLIAALEAGLVRSFPASVASPNGHTKILKQELLPWLRSRGFVDLADQISGPSQNPSVEGELPDPQRRLAALRALGGTVRFNKKQNFGWKFTLISKLRAQEVAAGKARSSEKTIRADLHDAADAERAAKASGSFPGFAQQ